MKTRAMHFLGIGKPPHNLIELAEFEFYDVYFVIVT